jgi:peroxiredoxin Q/BCP
MPVELRKRPAPKEPATAPPPTKRGSGAGNTAKKLTEKAKAAVTSKATKDDSVPTAAAEPKSNGTAGTGGKIGVGEKIALDGFGGTLQTNDGQDVTLKDVLDKSLAGIVLFTYPKASTPGCTSTLFCAYVFYLFGYERLTSSYRHHPSMPLPGQLRSNYGRIAINLWTQHGQSQGQ